MLQPQTSKTIFISSTFRDMQSERDILRDIALPKINMFAAEYGAQVELVDLRWGVDTADVSEEEQNHKVLRTCLDEIQRSRPFFIGILGDRYGWVPPEQDMNDAVEAVEYNATTLRQSVTALEIEFGALRAPEPPVCLFYFRHIRNYFMLDKKVAAVYRDRDEAHIKLESLKKEIRKKFEKAARDYDAKIVNGEITNLAAFADMVTGDIIAALKKEWGDAPPEPPGEEEQEAAALDTFRRSRTANFAGRLNTVQELRDHCLGGGDPQILLVQGEAGSGKSALMCRVMEEIEDKCLLLPASCGLTPRSSEPGGILRTLIWRLETRLGLESDEISTLKEIKERFFNLLHIAADKERVVVIIDALDQLYGGEEVQYMRWFNEKLPENVRVLFSIIGGTQVDAVRRLGGKIFPIPDIKNADIKDIIRSITRRHHKQIAGTVVDHILLRSTPDGRQAAQNPLYLSLLIQNLAMMDRYEHAVIDEYTAQGIAAMDAIIRFMKERVDQIPPDAEGAFLSVMERLERLAGYDFVRAVCGLIAVSRSGLRESDLGGVFKELKLKFNPADFSWLRQLLRGLFSQGDVRQWDFAHQSLRRALKKDRPQELERLNYGIVEYLLKIAASDGFIARESMHHLCLANRPNLAAQIIAGYGKIHKAAFARGLADAYIDHENGAEFLLAIPACLEGVEAAKNWRIAEILNECLSYLPENTRPFRIELMLAALSMLEGQDGDQPKRVTALCENSIAILYTETGETEKAFAYFQKSLDAREQRYELKETTTTLKALTESYIAMGLHLTAQGRTEEAGEYYRKHLDAAKKLSEQSDKASAIGILSASYYEMGNHLMAQGLVEEAGNYYKECINAAENHCARVGTASDSRILAISYSAMGSHLTDLGKVEEAGIYFKKCLDLFQQRYERYGTSFELNDLAVSCNRMSTHLIKLGKMEEAGLYFRKSLNANEMFYEQRQTIEALSYLAVSYGNMGSYLMKQGQGKEAIEYYQKALDADEKVYEQSKTVSALRSLSKSYSNMGNCLRVQGQKEKEEAGIYYQKSFDAYKKVYEQSGTVLALRDLAVVHGEIGQNFMDLGKMEDVETHYQKFIDIFEQLNEQMVTMDIQQDLAVTYYRMGIYLVKSGRLVEAGTYHQKSLNIREKLYEQSGTAEAMEYLLGSYKSIGKLLADLGQNEEAGVFFQKLIDMREKVYEQNGTIEALKNMAWPYKKMGDNLKALNRIEDAGVYYRKALEAREKIFEQSGTAEALNDLAASYAMVRDNLITLGRREEAEVYCQKAVGAREKIYGQNSTMKELKYLASSYFQTADNLKALNRLEEAGVYYLKALDAYEKIYGQNRTTEALGDMAVLYMNVRDNLITLGQAEEAEIYCQKTIDAYKRLYEQSGTDEVLNNLRRSYVKTGDNLMKLNRTEEAGDYYQKALDISGKLYEQSGTVNALRDFVVSYDHMGDNKHALKLFDEALAYRLKALELFERHVKLDPDQIKHDPYFRDKVISSYNDMGDHLAKLGQAEEAETYYKKALDMKQ